MFDDKIYFAPGDIVCLNKDITNKPERMMVVKKETKTFKNPEQLDNNFLIGIRCMWFTKNLEIQYGVFSTKDLLKIE